MSLFSLSNGAVPGELHVGLDTHSALRRVVLDLEGVKDVRLLPRKDRVKGNQRHKAFVVLQTHDIARDRRIIEIVCQLADVDVDLVPASSEGLIPDAAVSILH